MKRVIGWIVGIVAITALFGSGSQPKQVNPPQATPTKSIIETQKTTQPTIESQQSTTTTSVSPTSQPTANNSLSNNNTYTNSAGNDVHSPAYSTNSTVPAGATAQCGDGTYSFSQSRSGTCSHHGGVATWL